MRTVTLRDGADFDGWRDAARRLLAEGISPEQVTWSAQTQGSLFAAAAKGAAPSAVSAARVPAAFLPLAEALICHSDPQRYALAYRLLWRLSQREPKLLELITDPEVLRAREAEKNVRRDMHKMKAFVRFRQVNAADGEPVFIAWFEPAHYILERVAPFFVRRFTGMRWSILTPYRSAHWDGSTLHFGPAATKADAPSEDRLEEYWLTYYASIFNPARLKVQAMKSEMPMKYWKNLPEARLIPQLIREAEPRMQAMVAAAASTPNQRISFSPPIAAASSPGSLSAVREQAKNCRACALWQPATQTVFGEGPDSATLMIVGEQPGDLEDLAGKPFTGPAGQLLNRALAAAGIDRAAVYITNAVKHFKFEQRGKQRLHQSAAQAEQAACRPWLMAELEQVQPRLIVCLGQTAAQALLSNSFNFATQRGRWFRSDSGQQIIAAVHPSYLLRLRGSARFDLESAGLAKVLREVAEKLQKS